MSYYSKTPPPWRRCSAWRRYLPSGLTEYRSVMVMPDVSPLEYADFSLDDNARCQWEGFMVSAEILEAGDQRQRQQVVRWCRSFPFGFITDRQYVIARSLFSVTHDGVVHHGLPPPIGRRGGGGGGGGTAAVAAPAGGAVGGDDLAPVADLYCITKSIDHPGAYDGGGNGRVIQIPEYYSMWRCRTVACPWGGPRPAVEVVLLHSEDMRIPERLARRSSLQGGSASGLVEAAPLEEEVEEGEGSGLPQAKSVMLDLLLTLGANTSAARPDPRAVHPASAGPWVGRRPTAPSPLAPTLAGPAHSLSWAAAAIQSTADRASAALSLRAARPHLPFLLLPLMATLLLVFASGVLVGRALAGRRRAREEEAGEAATTTGRPRRAREDATTAAEEESTPAPLAPQPSTPEPLTPTPPATPPAELEAQQQEAELHRRHPPAHLRRQHPAPGHWRRLLRWLPGAARGGAAPAAPEAPGGAAAVLLDSRQPSDGLGAPNGPVTPSPRSSADAGAAAAASSVTHPHHKWYVTDADLAFFRLRAERDMAVPGAGAWAHMIDRNVPCCYRYRPG
ncbi:hypothetical protein TSOC_011214 [Tetrabaena socialis]|uniref:START domain-containing protein n=1 Tax=Tetrabaena socialis TaxID=47790 RepID=A0A2J7ZR83_9CHLO|nr:hypothetical protein TSOC_011214 [Tetrabaena socialis]|eukprot:PNH02772.1 hypothetical protein TSOC_011214 [Tetrabaena socialis]